MYRKHPVMDDWFSNHSSQRPDDGEDWNTLFDRFAESRMAL